MNRVILLILLLTAVVSESFISCSESAIISRPYIRPGIVGRSGSRSRSRSPRSGSGKILKRPGTRKIKDVYYYFRNYWYPYTIVDNRHYLRDYPKETFQCNISLVENHTRCFDTYNYYYDITNCSSAVYNIIAQADECLTSCNSTELDYRYFNWGSSINQSLYESCNVTFGDIINSINSSNNYGAWYGSWYGSLFGIVAAAIMLF